MKLAIAAILIVLAGIAGFVLGGSEPEFPASFEYGEHRQFSEPVLANGADIRFYAALLHDVQRGRLPFPETVTRDFEAAEAMSASDAISNITAYPHTDNALYTLLRGLDRSLQSALELGRPGDVHGILLELNRAEAAMYLALHEDNRSAYDAASRTSFCVTAAVGEDEITRIATECLPPLAEYLEGTLGFRPKTSAP